MGLFVKKTETGANAAPLYTLGSQKTVLIVGLGNIGKEFDGTRHNIGFFSVDALVKDQGFPEWIVKRDLKCHFTDQNLGDTRVILIKPTTLMNNSGQAVQAVQHFYKITNSQTLVVHDELDINFGQIRTRVGGSDAGNNGIKSLIQHIGEDFRRVRIGIKNDLLQKQDSADFVLAKFNKDEQAKLPDLSREVVSILTEYVFGGDLNHETRSFLS